MVDPENSYKKYLIRTIFLVKITSKNNLLKQSHLYIIQKNCYIKLLCNNKLLCNKLKVKSEYTGKENTKNISIFYIYIACASYCY